MFSDTKLICFISLKKISDFELYYKPYLFSPYKIEHWFDFAFQLCLNSVFTT
jgi:hypothetical protein